MGTAKESPSPALSEFKHITPNISLYTPPFQPPDYPSLPSPTLIILTTWFSALPRHVSKYTSIYQTLFPRATILILQTSSADMLYRSDNAQQERLKCILPLVHQHENASPEVRSGAEARSRPGKGSGILLHIFSNAGALTASQLVRSYHSVYHRPLQVGAMILDSAPGTMRFGPIYTAQCVGLPRTPVLKQLLSSIAFGTTSWIALQATLGEGFIEMSRRVLNDKNLLSTDQERGRLYIYSVADVVIAWEDVEKHANEAEERGERVEREKWVDTEHLAHMPDDGQRYWGAVRRIWEKSGDAFTIRSKL